jgi:hemolysin D
MTDKDLRAKSFATALEDHSAEGIEILSSEPSRLMRATIYLIFSLLAAGLAWSFIGRADVIVTSTGNLEPESEARRVYSPLDGELIDIYMAEGMPVEKGDVLARVDAVQAVQVATQALEAQLKLTAAEKAYRLYPDQVKRIKQKIEELKQRIADTKQVRDKLLSEGRAKLGENYRLKLQKSRAKLDKAVREMELAKEVWQSHERLFNSPGQGGVSKQKVEEKKNDYQSKVTDYQLAKAALGEFEVELNKEIFKNNADIRQKNEDIARLRGEMAQQTEQLKDVKIKTETQLQLARVAAAGSARIKYEDIDEDNFLRIRAPVSGVITSVAYTQPGDKVERKKPIGGIAPAETRAVLKVEIDERDRGFLREGMRAKIKFNAFPYQRYGYIEGTLEYIAPDTTLNPRTKKPVYRGRIGLDKDHVSVGEVQYPLRYGMTANAEIVVRKRRVIDLALDPFRQVAG